MYYLYNKPVRKKEELKVSFIETIKARAKEDKKTIVLPEATDIRVLKATDAIIKVVIKPNEASKQYFHLRESINRGTTPPKTAVLNSIFARSRKNFPKFSLLVLFLSA